jgi:hypothetical protein
MVPCTPPRLASGESLTSGAETSTGNSATTSSETMP